MKIEEQRFLLEVAKLAAARSSGVRLKVGAVVADQNGNLIATGYNGSVRGGDNCLEHKIYSPNKNIAGQVDGNFPLWDSNSESWYKLVTKESTIHAEQNLIAHAAKRGISINNASVFVTHSPCAKCTSLLIQSGAREITYIDEHRSCSDVKLEFGSMISIKQWIDE